MKIEDILVKITEEDRDTITKTKARELAKKLVEAIRTEVLVNKSDVKFRNLGKFTIKVSEPKRIFVPSVGEYMTSKKTTKIAFRVFSGGKVK